MAEQKNIDLQGLSRYDTLLKKWSEKYKLESVKNPDDTSKLKSGLVITPGEAVTGNSGLSVTPTTIQVNTDNHSIIIDENNKLAVNPETLVTYLAGDGIDISEESVSNKIVKIDLLSGEKVLNFSNGKLQSNLSITEVTGNSVPADVLHRFQLSGINGEKLGQFIDIKKDSSLVKMFVGRVGDKLVNGRLIDGEEDILDNYVSDDATVQLMDTGDTSLNYLNRLSDGKFQLVHVNLEKFLVETEIGRGLQAIESPVGMHDEAYHGKIIELAISDSSEKDSNGQSFLTFTADSTTSSRDGKILVTGIKNEIDHKISERTAEIDEAVQTVNLLAEEVNSLIDTTSRIHVGEFNAGNTEEEGWYDSITSGRPEGSESDEKYVMYQSSNGTQICFSKRNSGKAYHRLDKNHSWVLMGNDDREAFSSIFGNTLWYTGNAPITEWDYSNNGASINGLIEFYAGDNLEKTHFHFFAPVECKSGDIINVNCFYRKGSSPEGLDNYPFDSDAYIFVSNSTSESHGINELKSNFLKVLSMGRLDHTWTQNEHDWLGLGLAQNLFDEGLGKHYLQITDKIKGTRTFYLHIVGDASVAKSWFVFSDASKYTGNSSVDIAHSLNDFIDRTTTDIGNIQEELDNITFESMTNTTWAELKTLRDSGELLPGQYYRITDYVTTTAQPYTQSAGHPFDVILQADSKNVLSEDAFAIKHDDDDYFADSKLEAWELKYCIDNDDTRFAWADETNGKGVIYYMKDEFDNECPYDFKNIQFVNYNIEEFNKNPLFANTFDGYRDIDGNLFPSGATISTVISLYRFTFDINTRDLSLNKSSMRCYNNVIKQYYAYYKLTLNNIVFNNAGLPSHTICKNKFDAGCCNMRFAANSNSNVFGNNCNSNIFGNNCNSNIFGNYCNYNIFGNSCNYNTFGTNCNYNIFGNYYNYNIFGNYCNYNIFGNYCNSNEVLNDTTNCHIQNTSNHILTSNEVIYNTDELYQTKDNVIYPISHPDLSTQPSILPQRFGNLNIYEVLIPLNSQIIDYVVDESYIPKNATILESSIFCDQTQLSSYAKKTSEGWTLSAYSFDDIIESNDWWALIRYIINNNGDYYYYSLSEDHDYSKDYLTFTALEDTSFRFTQNALQYSLDDGATWNTLAADTVSPTITAGNKIMWKQTGLTPSGSMGIGTFLSSGNFEASGNIMSLYYGDDFSGQTDLTGKNYAFASLFDSDKLVTCENLILPATTLATGCYSSMFGNCTSLVTAPELPATTLANYCYSNMFYGCTSLVTAPSLPATTLATECYNSMFFGCTSLTIVNIIGSLPALTFYYCFNNNTSIYINSDNITIDNNAFTNNLGYGSLYLQLGSKWIADNNLLNQFVGWKIYVDNIYMGLIDDVPPDDIPSEDTTGVPTDDIPPTTLLPDDTTIVPVNQNNSNPTSNTLDEFFENI